MATYRYVKKQKWIPPAEVDGRWRIGHWVECGELVEEVPVVYPFKKEMDNPDQPPSFAEVAEKLGYPVEKAVPAVDKPAEVC